MHARMLVASAADDGTVPAEQARRFAGQVARAGSAGAVAMAILEPGPLPFADGNVSRRALDDLAARISALVAPLGQAPMAVPLRPRSHPVFPRRARIELGAAVWYACTTTVFLGPPPLGCPVLTSAITSPASYFATWSQRFDRLTPENELKPVWTEPLPSEFDFRAGDQIVRLAQSEGKHVRGHALVYDQADPGWISRPSTPWSRATLLAAMQDHITTEVTHFRDAFPGVVDEWDVVNEPFLDSGARKQNIYQRVIGDDWIEQAFRSARAADPHARLFLNEYDADTPGPRQRALLALATDLVARHVPLDGIGLEMHAGAGRTYPTLAGIKTVMRDYARIGLRVAITELDALRLRTDADGAAQLHMYDIAAEACRESPNCTGLTVWGVSDAYSWRGWAEHATLFDGLLSDGCFAAKIAPGATRSTYDSVRCRLTHPWPTAVAPRGVDRCGACRSH